MIDKDKENKTLYEVKPIRNKYNFFQGQGKILISKGVPH